MKKGFTLVELLAVIAILAILIIIALPNILEMFNKAKIDSFVNEARSVYKTAQQRYVADGAQAECYSNDEDTSCESLEMSGRSNIYYIVGFSTDGDIIFFLVWDDNYNIFYRYGDPIEIEDIDSSSVNEGGKPEPE